MFSLKIIKVVTLALALKAVLKPVLGIRPRSDSVTHTRMSKSKGNVQPQIYFCITYDDNFYYIFSNPFIKCINWPLVLTIFTNFLSPFSNFEN